MGSRRVPLTRELWIEQDDFREEPPKKFFRLAPGREVRLRYGCLITCNELVKDADGKVIELRCTWDPDSKGGNAPDGRKVKGTLHWVSASHGVQAEVRLYDRLFRSENPADDKDGGDWKNGLNPESLQVLPVCYVEPSLADAAPGRRFQFERLGYFCADKDARPGKPVFNRTVALRDSWAKAEAKE
jgi:glutaminyl-tRNA synthetase